MSESCCRKCKTVMQLCTNHKCFCHLIRDHSSRGRITYQDPTGNTATARIDRQRRKKLRKKQHR